MSNGILTHNGECTIAPKRDTSSGMKYPNRIKDIREQMGLTREALAKKANTIPGQIYKLETGERKLTHAWMVRLAKPLNCNPSDFITNTFSPNENETQRESELAIIYVLKVILQIMMQHQMVSTKGLDFNFSEALTFYHGRKLGKAAQIMEKLRVFVADEPRVLEQAINRILLEPEPQRPA